MSFRQRLLSLSLTVLTALAVGCSNASQPVGYNSNASTTTSGSDDPISARVQRRVAEGGLLDVQVRATADGQVFLTGYVDDDLQRAQAEKIAKETPGVIAVQNGIAICKKPPVNVNKPGGPRRC